MSGVDRLAPRVTEVDYVNRDGGRVTGAWVVDDDPRHHVDLTPPPGLAAAVRRPRPFTPDEDPIPTPNTVTKGFRGVEMADDPGDAEETGRADG